MLTVFHKRFLFTRKLGNRSFRFGGFKVFLFHRYTTHQSAGIGRASDPGFEDSLASDCYLVQCPLVVLCGLRVVYSGPFAFLYKHISSQCNVILLIPLLSAIDFANSFRSFRTRSRWICVHLSKRSVKRLIFALRSSNAKLMGAKETIETGVLSAIFCGSVCSWSRCR
jgi:hypothetical protein